MGSATQRFNVTGPVAAWIYNFLLEYSIPETVDHKHGDAILNPPTCPVAQPLYGLPNQGEALGRQIGWAVSRAAALWTDT